VPVNLSIDRIVMSDVLFQRGQGYASDMWDDAELIAAWNRQTSGVDSSAARARLDAARNTAADADDDGGASTSHETSASGSPQEATTAQNRTTLAPKPPMPDWADEATRKLLEAWFEAGYWSGFKAGQLRGSR
jgi:hypothetical protein